jgi:hypothetical protein
MSTLTRDELSPAQARAIHGRILRDPEWFVEHFLGAELWSKQREILQSVRDHPRTVVRSCHGVGKTWTAARVVLWWLAAHADSCAVVTTAPTWQQVEEVLWREIHRAVQSSIMPVGGKLDLVKLEVGKDRFAIGLSPDPNKATNFQGFHAEHLLFVVDEASGVDERIFEAAEGFQTAHGAKMLMIGNPTAVSGTFWDAFNKSRSSWKQIHISAFDSPNFTGEDVSDDMAAKLPSQSWVDEKRGQWGDDSPTYQIRVLGDFPDNAENAIIPRKALEDAMQRKVAPVGSVGYPVVIGVDVARYGSDHTVFAFRDGWRCRIVEDYTGASLMQTVGKIIEYAKRYSRHAWVRIVIDDAGLGGGVVDRLREVQMEQAETNKGHANHWQIEAFNGGAKAQASDDYPNRRTEAWATMRSLLRGEVEGCQVIDPVSGVPSSLVEFEDDEELRNDLLSPLYTHSSAGRITLEKKDDTKKRLGRSPDRGDAVVMAFAPEVGAAQVVESPW